MENKKFVESYDINDFEVLTDNGWEDIKSIHKTIPYKIWKIKTDNHFLECADNHIVFKDDFTEIFVKDLVIGDSIITKKGIETIISIEECESEDNMYDLELDSDSNHRYYTNGILSHNTATSISYLLWYAMAFHNKNILMTSFGQTSANKNLADVKLLYENCPNFLKKGIVSMNASNIKFDNGSQIFSRPTTGKSVRGLSPAIIYCDEFAFVGTTGSGKNNTLQDEFYSAVSPALSASKGKIIITSTPISQTDLFYRLWTGAIERYDSKGIKLPCSYILKINGELYRDFHLFNTKEEAQEYVNSLDTTDDIEIVEKESVGSNGYMAQLTTWDKCPTKTQEWAIEERKKIGDSRFDREYNCLSGDSQIMLLDKQNNSFNSSLKMLYDYHLL